ncbi:DegV family protein [Chloroflexota bacterium]
MRGPLRNVAIVVDSIACLDREMVEQHGITVMPLSFYFKDKIYRDWVDVTPSEAYELFLKDPDSFKTSTVSPGIYLEAYREIGKQASGILCVTVSSRISACHTAAMDAREQVKAELPDVPIEIMDSKMAGAAEGFIAMAAARAAAEGKSLDEVVEAAREVKDKVHFICFLETLRHVYRSGRIPKVASQLGSVLNIKPILKFSSGALHFVGIARSKKNGIERLLKALKGKVGENSAHIAIMHAYALDEAEKLKERISSEFNCSELWISEFSPLMGYACGTGTLGIAFYTDD